MIFTRSQLEAQEVSRLASYAVKSGQSRGRFYTEKSDLTRTSFQRDRDRVIHSKAFRRSKGKTQVFVAHYGDHYRSRMMHSMEVAQISRDMARTLGLNEDLAETIALAHDLGHTPFGHAGETTLHEMMQPYGLRFEHNEQSLRIVERLEYRYADFIGLNLTYEVRDGLIKHRTTYDHPPKRGFGSAPSGVEIDHPMASLEAQLVNLADEIAYQNHDIDDGLRSGILTVKKLNGIALWKKAQEGVTMEPGEEVWISMTVSALIKLMIHDVCRHSDALLNHHFIRTLEDVYQTAAPLIAFSPEMQMMNDELKMFLHSHFYQSEGVTKYNLTGQKAIQVLFAYFMDHFEAIPLDPRADRTEPRAILVKDYVAGMTDNFALEMYRKL